MENNRVVITGMGALTPIGNNLNDYWDGLQKGVSGAAPITKFDARPFRTHFACELKDFDPGDFLDRKEIRRLDPFAQYAMVAADEAYTHAGLNDDVDKDRVGVIWCSGIGGILTFQDEMEGYFERREDPKISPFFIPKMILDIAAGHISMKYGLRGPNYAVVSACASSTHGLIDAFTHLKLNRADAFIIGGSEMAITQGGLGGFNAIKALSERNDDPLTASRPFDLDRDGFVMGEGAGAMVLEREEHALARGATIYGEVLGGGMSADAYHMTAPHPEGIGALNVMKNACKDANIDPTEIDYINVHGTSTPLGDISEVMAIQQLLGEKAYDISISSTKSMTGHLLGAAGIIEGLACVMAINKNIVPPTINHFNDDPQFDAKLDFTFNKAKARKVNVALSNTFGFGGHNASVIFKKYEQ